MLLSKSLDLAHVWSDSDADASELDDILALAAAVYMFVKMHLPQQRYSRTLPELLTKVAELLTKRQPNDDPVSHTAGTIQQVTRVELRVLEILEFELPTLTPAAWIEIFSRRHSLWQQQQQLQPPDLAVPPAALDGRGPHPELLLLFLVLQPVRSAQGLGSFRLYCGYSCAFLQRSEHMPAPSHCFSGLLAPLVWLVTSLYVGSVRSVTIGATRCDD